MTIIIAIRWVHLHCIEGTSFKYHKIYLQDHSNKFLVPCSQSWGALYSGHIHTELKLKTDLREVFIAISY